jgi:hypothetical protein
VTPRKKRKVTVWTMAEVKRALGPYLKFPVGKEILCNFILIAKARRGKKK